MKIVLNCLIIILLSSCASKKPISTVNTRITKPNTDTNAILLGDLNFDKIADTAFVSGPKYLDDEKLYGDCSNGSCSIDIYFSSGEPSLHFEDAIYGNIENIGDIDKDGFCEILISQSWWVGCRGRIHVYSLKNKAWKYYGYADNNICGRDKLSEFILKTEGNTISLEEIVWDQALEDESEKPKTFTIQ